MLKRRSPSESEIYDAIIMGARCAGSPLAMLLARRGYRILVVDKARFPSDKISTHMVWPPGVAALHRWGIWGQVAKCNPALMDTGAVTIPAGKLVGPWHDVEGVNYTLGLRRFKLDAVLVQAARDAGAEVREGIAVTSLLGDNGRVTGIEAIDRSSGRRFREHAKIVVGADGSQSYVAAAMGAETYDTAPVLTANLFAYFADMAAPRNVIEIVTEPPREHLVVPADDDLTVVNLIVSREIADDYRQDTHRKFYEAFDKVPELGERVRNARLVSKVYRYTALPNFYRKPFGPGWALVGDAGHSRDPILAQGMHEAFLDAESLADALDDGFSGRESLEESLQRHEKQRNARTWHTYRLCLQAAQFHLPSMERSRRFLGVLRDDPELIGEYRGLIAGSTDPLEFNRKLRERCAVSDSAAR